MGRYSGINLAVFGDYMWDRWLEPSDVKKCPGQAAMDYVGPFKTLGKPGGAGNQATNVLSLGGNCTAFYMRGGDEDEYSNDLTLWLKIKGADNAAVYGEGFTTHYKEYYEYGGKLLSRISNHDGVYDSDKMYGIVKHFENTINEYDGLIIADYNKGSMLPQAIRALMGLCKSADIPVFVDPKFDNWNSYTGATIFKPNVNEWQINKHTSLSPYIYTVITKGHNGMDICCRDNPDVLHIPAVSGDVFDINGAGDSVMAAMALEYIYNGGDILKAANVGNIAGGICVGHRYTYQVTEEDLVERGAFEKEKVECPECGSSFMVSSGGCLACRDCGWSKCG